MASELDTTLAPRLTEMDSFTQGAEARSALAKKMAQTTTEHN